MSELVALYDEEGYKCAIVRHPELGHLCGYIGVTVDHPWYKMDYDNEALYAVNVHGGLTFAEMEGYSTPYPCASGDPNRWWLGFDCAHWGDKTNFSLHGVKRSVSYVRKEITRLVKQAVAAKGDN